MACDDPTCWCAEAKATTEPPFGYETWEDYEADVADAVRRDMQPKPDVQARAEISAVLNRPPLLIPYDPERDVEGLQYRLRKMHETATELKEERDNALRASYEWETLYTIAIGAVLDLREKLRQREDDVRSWGLVAQQTQQEIDYLTSGLKNYAAHAWNDIKRDLESKGWL